MLFDYPSLHTMFYKAHTICGTGYKFHSLLIHTQLNYHSLIYHRDIFLLKIILLLVHHEITCSF